MSDNVTIINRNGIRKVIITYNGEPFNYSSSTPILVEIKSSYEYPRHGVGISFEYERKNTSQFPQPVHLPSKEELDKVEAENRKHIREIFMTEIHRSHDMTVSGHKGDESPQDDYLKDEFFHPEETSIQNEE
jgi:hypothetical protein